MAPVITQAAAWCQLFFSFCPVDAWCIKREHEFIHDNGYSPALRPGFYTDPAPMTIRAVPCIMMPKGGVSGPNFIKWGNQK